MFDRRTIRLQGFDYSQPGVYYVSIGTRFAQPLLGTRVGSKVEMSALGILVQEQWQEIPRHHPFVRLDAFDIQPTHLHGLLVWRGTGHVGGAEAFSRPTKNSLPTVVRTFKGRVTSLWRRGGGVPAVIWQGRFLERVVRSRKELASLRCFIHDNALWHRLCDRDSW